MSYSSNDHQEPAFLEGKYDTGEKPLNYFDIKKVKCDFKSKRASLDQDISFIVEQVQWVINLTAFHDYEYILRNLILNIDSFCDWNIHLKYSSILIFYTWHHMYISTVWILHKQ